MPRTKHGLCHTPEYRVWQQMHRRCYVKHSPSYSRYGGRGITVCERWHDIEGLLAFVEDMGWRPGKGWSLDRIDNDGNYSPENCRWATSTQQARNKGNNHRITFNGETRTLAGWAEHLGVCPSTMKTRVVQHKWNKEKALTSRDYRTSVPEEVVRQILDRRAAGETQQSLADRFGVSRSYVGKLSRGERRRELTC